MDAILERCVRHRIIELLETIVSTERSRAIGPEGVVNLWYDFVPSPEPGAFPEPAYTPEERDAIFAVGGAMNDLVKATPRQMPGFDVLEREESWLALVQRCKDALSCFALRGRSAE